MLFVEAEASRGEGVHESTVSLSLLSSSRVPGDVPLGTVRVSDSAVIHNVIQVVIHDHESP